MSHLRTTTTTAKGDCGLAAPIGLGRSTTHPSAPPIGRPSEAGRPTLLYSTLRASMDGAPPPSREHLSSLAPLTPPTAEAATPTQHPDLDDLDLSSDAWIALARLKSSGPSGSCVAFDGELT